MSLHYKYAGILSVLLIGGLFCALSGCKSPQELKKEADEDVYNIIDQKWQEKFGYKANYRVIDTEPNIIEVKQLIPPSGILSLDQSVDMAIQFSRDYQRQKESLYLSALSLTGVRHDYETQWFGTIDAFYEWDTDAETMFTDTQVGAERQFLLGDTMLISTRLASDWLRYIMGDPRTSLTSVFSASLSTPLLGVGQATLAREQLTQSERNVLYAIRNFSFNRKDFVIDVIDAYYNVLLQRNSVEIQKASYQRLVDSTNQLRMEVEVGQRPAYDLAEAEQRLLSAEQNVVDRQQNYELAMDRFKIRLALPTDIELQLDPNELNFLVDDGVSQPEYPVQDAVEAAMIHRLDLANVRDSLDDSERQLILAAKGLGPQVELSLDAAAYSYDRAGGLPDTQLTRLRFHEGVYSAQLLADLPFDQLDERNAYRRALIDVQQEQRSYDQTN